MRHLLAIPFESFDVVFIAIEEMNFAGCFLNAWMKIQHLEKRSRSALPHAYDETLMQTKQEISLKYCLHIQEKREKIASDYAILITK